MINNKPWMYGPYNIKYQPCPILYSQECNKKKSSQKINLTTNLNSKPPLVNKKKSWREASVKSHKLFIYDTKDLTII
jgi:hypothetical protein